MMAHNNLNDDEHVQVSSSEASTAPISRLSPQLLSGIFMYNVWNDRLQADRHRGYEALKAIHLVCTHWRKVALGCPILWSQSINFEQDHPKRTRRLLDLSHPSPLVVEATLSIHDRLNPAGANVKLAFVRLPRVRALRLNMPEIHLTQLLPALDQPAPALESLSLRNNDHQRSCDLPPLFAHQTPKLRSLDIRNCILRWDSPLLANLTRLVIYNTSNAARPSWAQFFTVLSSMPMLTVLSLDFASPQHSTSTTEQKLGDHLISLPHLSKFHLSDNIATCTYITSCLIFPPDSGLSLRCEDTGTDIDASDILRWLRTRLSVMTEEKTLQDLSIHGEGYHFGLLGWINAPWHEHLPFVPLHQPQVEVHFYFPGPNDDDISRLIVATCEAFPLNQVKRLEISSQAIHVPRKAWSPLLRQRRGRLCSGISRLSIPFDWMTRLMVCSLS